ncbi:MAG: tryptophan 7-halogenase [Pseudomonadota bacterium]|nr:tryptophan 7-halogenase [Pseudomonadota bacterium]
MRRKVVIVGGGVAGWMAAAALARALPVPHYAVTLVETAGEDRSLGCFGPAEASLPSIRRWHSRLGIDEDELVGTAGGSFTLGIAFSGWSRPGHAWFAPFGEIGATLGSVPFHHLAARLRASGQRLRLADFSLAAIAAQTGRFARPAEDPSSVLSSYSYGLHLPRCGYREFLQQVALRAGAALVPGPFSRAELADDGRIAAVVLEDGARVEGDLFIDCSGPHASLIEGALATGFESWRRWLPCDRAAEFLCQAGAAPVPYSHNAAQGGGWSRTVPLQGRTGEAFVYCSAFVPEEAAQAQALGGLSGPAQSERRSSFEPGRRRLLWNRNCIAIGAAAALLEPIHPTSLHLVHSALERLIALFPEDADAPAEAAEFNRLGIAELERLRDFAILPYKLNGRVGEPFWDACRAMEVPDSLGYKIELYRSRGRVPLYDGDMFEEADWVALLDEQGVRPRRYDVMADRVPPEYLYRHMARVRELVLKGAASLPPHGEYLRRHCPHWPAREGAT